MPNCFYAAETGDRLPPPWALSAFHWNVKLCVTQTSKLSAMVLMVVLAKGDKSVPKT